MSTLTKWSSSDECYHFTQRFAGRLKEYNIRKRSSRNAEHSVSRRYYLIVIVVLSMPGGFHDVYVLYRSLFFNLTLYYFFTKKSMRLYVGFKFKIRNRPQLLYFPQDTTSN